MNDSEKINFLINTFKNNDQRFPHTLVVTEDFSLSEAFALDVSTKLCRELVTINATMINSPGDLAGIVTHLNTNHILLIEDINLFNKECHYLLYDIIEKSRLSLLIDSGCDARSVEVTLNDFTVIGSVAKIHLLPKKILSLFFCIVEGQEISRFGVEAINKILKDEIIFVSNDVSEYIFSLTDSIKVELKSFLKNLIIFFRLKGFTKKNPISCSMVDEYFNFYGISNFKKESVSSRQILIDVQRDVWRRDQGKCVFCQSQERLEYDHIIPFSKGGSNTIRNIQLLCESCNREKSSKI